ncbi:RNA polymerase sigma factor [Chitinophaga agrisoli]|uniref:RNA polymerase sigma factor n=1 Tax=Chitinophaga agrisoli TaxID=2607653 RepID=A0A5B2VX94_9BACT|nr:RNA polymerase sigma factor [Chitinophaga agrisoli]KAA2242629.1 RNA polymerase sigma factor [Chitinophaga agrisoli]
MYPFAAQYDETKDRSLIEQVYAGSREAAEQLVRLHQRFIYNLALKLVRDADDAADLTQEVLIRMLTRLHQFEFKSSFRTWLYRMVMNHFLSAQRKKAEKDIHSFEELGVVCEELHSGEDMTAAERDEYREQIIDVRNRCMASTLLCLDREQRIILILGAIFNLKSPVAAQLLDITPENFRKQLSRAKHDLFQFMDNKCGLINPNNPCRCHKKTKGFIKEGKVDAVTRQFTPDALESIGALVGLKNKELDQLMEGKYLSLFTAQPYEPMPEEDKLIASLLMDPNVKALFLLNQ